MANEASFELRRGYVIVSVTGELISFEDTTSFLKRLVAKCRKHRCEAVLLDATGVVGEIEGLTRFQLAHFLSHNWPPDVRLALLLSEEWYIPDYLLESVLHTHGIEGKDFVRREDAIAWIEQTRTYSAEPLVRGRVK